MLIYGAEYGYLFLCLLKLLKFQLIALSVDFLEFCILSNKLVGFDGISVVTISVCGFFD
jgi:hypothetical protein